MANSLLGPENAKDGAGKMEWSMVALATNPGDKNSIPWNPSGGNGELTSCKLSSGFGMPTVALGCPLHVYTFRHIDAQINVIENSRVRSSDTNR